MAGVTKVNGFVQSDQFFGRTIVGITVAVLATAPADVDNEHVKWPELDAAVQAIETICTVSVVGAYTGGAAEEINLIVEGVDAVGDKYKSAGQDTYDMTIFEKLQELVTAVTAGSSTVVVFAI